MDLFLILYFLGGLWFVYFTAPLFRNTSLVVFLLTSYVNGLFWLPLVCCMRIKHEHN